ncbi:MAG: uL30 family ribosomal protein [Candidatus Pacearchaeota archaeon]|nr:uL30 family ribosomal protein [Candidatus Pacearchaeota archaeon]
MAKIIILRVGGKVNVPPDVRNTLDKLRLRKKFACVIVDDTPALAGKLKKIQNYVSYGALAEETLIGLLIKRARLPGNKPLKIEEKTANNFAKEIIQGKKKLEDLGIKKFFSLHPPRGGFKKDTRKLFPVGILGKNEKINELIMKML